MTTPPNKTLQLPRPRYAQLGLSIILAGLRSAPLAPVNGPGN
jgi:hypothetical protein